MKCREFHNLLDRFLDGEISYLGREELEIHREECLACQELYNQRMTLFKKLTILKNSEENLDLTDEIMASINHMPTLSNKSPFHIPVIIAIITTMAFSILIFFLGIGSILSNFSLFDIFNTLIKFIDLPQGMQDNLIQGQTFLKGWFIAFKTIIEYLANAVASTGSFSYIAISIVILIIIGAATRIINRYITRNSHVSH